MKKHERELAAIELGKVWMKKSVNKSHDWNHADKVVQHSLKILESLETEERVEKGVTKNLTEICAWWHDSYKSRLKRSPVSSLFNEGFKSEDIVREELRKYLGNKELEIVSNAIRVHHFPIAYFLFNKAKFTGLTQVLYEADHLDVLREDRFEWLKNPFLKLAYRLYSFNIRVMLGMLPVSRYTRRYLNNLKG